jgi:RNA polymerase sigma factor (sigma-70 family)
MRTAVVTEIARPLAAVTRDTFVDEATSPVAPVRAARPKLPRDDREHDLVALVEAARSGDAAAWSQLVERFDRMLRRTAGSYRLAPADVDEVVQETWLELLETIGRLREPAAIGGWLATVTRRNAFRRRQLHVREQLTDDPGVAAVCEADGPQDSAIAAERHDVLAYAVTALPDRHRRLVTALLHEPALDYRQIAERLSMPVGSIGPIRARALKRLARDTRLRALSDQRCG